MQLIKRQNKLDERAIIVNEYLVDIEDVVDSFRVKWLQGNHLNANAFSRINDTGTDLLMCCPFHSETKASFGIQKEYPYLCNCFSCGSGGNLIDLIQLVYECNYFEAMRILRREFAILMEDFDIEEIFEVEEVEIEEDSEDIEDEILEYSKFKHSYINDRGISDHTLIKYEIGYDEKNTSITFPVRGLDGKPLFIVRRGIHSKFYHIPKDAPKGSVLYGLNYLKGKVDHCYLVEGMVDVLSCYEAGMASVGLGGRMLSDLQVNELLDAGIKEITLLFDNDKWGIVGTLQAYKVLEKYPIAVRVAQYPERWGIDSWDCEYSDPNDLLRGGKLKDIKIISYIDYYLNILSSRQLRRKINE